ncbi:MAG TPA: HlyD family efflux transporter periplasmic adaptor subunit, partial [Thermoanaerobaculia bacterium]|nr:HlyD family efflux transporter periplasmic adaptor subunit [Thermoanaerobaculia bacterium]
GNLRATRATPVTVPGGIEGALRVAWLAPDGGRVKAGDAVVRFDPTEMEKNLRGAEDDLATARFKAQKERAESAADLEKLDGDARVAQLELDGAARFQKKDDVIFSRAERIESEIDGTLAREREKHAREARRTSADLARTELDLLAIQERQAAYKIETARSGLKALSILAPHDGILVFRRDFRGNPVRVGDSVWQGQPLAEIPDLARMQAEVYVLEADASGLGVGKPATVELESAPGLVYGARVARVDALAKPRLRGSPVQYFAVTLELERTDPLRMKPGARVRSWLTLDRLTGALTVPLQAVQERDGRSFVYRRSGAGRGGFEPRPVTLGPAGMGRVVIESGLASGDVVALRDPARAADAPRPVKTGSGPSAPAPPPAMPDFDE